MRHSAYKITEPTLSLNGSGRELEILDLLQRYDLLPSDFIYQATGNYEGIRKTLRRLAKGCYVGFPDFATREEKLAHIPRNRNYVYELKDRGSALLGARRIKRVRGNDHFKHKLLRSKVEFLLDRDIVQSITPE